MHLVFVDGIPVYGDPNELGQWAEKESLDEIVIGKHRKTIHMIGDRRAAWHAGQHFDELVRILNASLGKVAPLVEEDK